MEQHHTSSFFFFLTFHLLLLYFPTAHGQLLPIVDGHANAMHTYIIDVERHEHHDLLTDQDLKSWHASFLPNSTLDSGVPRLIYSYRHVFSGFSASLTLGELESLKSKPGFLFAQRIRRYHTTTTHTPEYLGLSQINGWGSTMMGQGIIIGIIDTGIKPSHPSFDDSMMPPPPTKWKGSCSYKGFQCNKKIIGAMAFHGRSQPSPLDTEGHGTHVASIAAGSFVKNANVLGTARGTSSGMAPKAYLSVYKVCYPPPVKCPEDDIYAGIDQAIKDGVDVINMSLSGGRNSTFYSDPVTRGSMAATRNMIIPVVSAGNNGGDPSTLGHSAPWVLTVGATTTDRRIESYVELDNGRTFMGESAYQPKTWNPSIQYPLIYPGENLDEAARACLPSAMATLNLRGKIVICEPAVVENDVRGEAVYKAGAEGMIVVRYQAMGHHTEAYADLLPTSNINRKATVEMVTYYLNNTNTKASIRFNGTTFGFMPSPSVAFFSSRGPSRMNGGIIKPDVVAPGVNILAAWHKGVGPNPSPLATHTFNFEKGTSMAAPHVSGIAALIRKKHLGWTPSEIISAIVTTANDSWKAGSPDDIIVDEITHDAAGIFTTGAGMVSPIKAMDPGLVFGLTLEDYVGYLCGLGYSDWEVYRTVPQSYNCIGVKKLSSAELNYPSIAVNFTRSVVSQKVTRKAKNVGDAREEYNAKFTEPPGVKIYLSTYKLKFTRPDEEVSYEMTFEMAGRYPSQGSEMIRRGKIVWDSGKHVVTTPIAVTFE